MNPIYKLFCRIFQICFRTILPILPYRMPTQLDGVAAVPEVLASKRINRVLLVIDRTVRQLGLTQELEQLLKDASIVTNVYDQYRANPTIDDVEAARALYLERNAQAIIAVGGGSAIDCAKACGARIARPGKPVTKMRGILKILKKTPLTIAIPTTAGTGSEATLAAVITDAKTKYKYPINDFPLIPDYAVLDPQLTVKLPPHVTATTGLDALTHAVEAYIGRSTTAETRAMSEEAVVLIHKYLREAVVNGSNLEARSGMLRAAFCAAVSFTRSYVGYIHAVAHTLGGQYGTAHGYANAVILPQVLELYGPSCHKKLAKLSRIAGVADECDSDDIASRKFIDWIYELNEEFGIPKTFEEIREEDIPIMAARAAVESNPLYPVPKIMSTNELADIYRMLAA